VIVFCICFDCLLLFFILYCFIIRESFDSVHKFNLVERVFVGMDSCVGVLRCVVVIEVLRVCFHVYMVVCDSSLYLYDMIKCHLPALLTLTWECVVHL